MSSIAGEQDRHDGKVAATRERAAQRRRERAERAEQREKAQREAFERYNERRREALLKGELGDKLAMNRDPAERFRRKMPTTDSNVVTRDEIGSILRDFMQWQVARDRERSNVSGGNLGTQMLEQLTMTANLELVRQTRAIERLATGRSMGRDLDESVMSW